MEVDNAIVQDIQLMMHGCGDSSHPLLASARIVASTTRQQILSIIFRAESSMLQQGTRAVSPRDIVFLLRNKPQKLRRFLQYYSVKMFRSSMNSMSGDVDSLSSRDLSQLGAAPDKSAKTPFKEIIKLLDNTGELEELLSCNGLSIHNDVIRKERDQRADFLSQRLDHNRYLLFTKARSMAFATNQPSAVKFLEWLQIGAGDTPLPKLTSQAVEILGYLAKETVAEIVDLALLVRKDSAGPPGGPLRPLTLRAPTNTSTRTLDSWPPLSPAEIREALRRFSTPIVGFNGGSIFGRNCSHPYNQQFLAL